MTATISISGQLGLDRGRRTDPVELGHDEVHQDDVGPQSTGFLDRLASIGRLANDLDVVEELEETPQPASDHGVVVDQEHPDPRRRLVPIAVVRGHARSCRPGRSLMEVKGTRISRNTSTETRNPPNRNTTPRNFPSWKSSVAPNRFKLSVTVGMKAPTAIRIVAGTREWMRPVAMAATAPGK